MVEVVHKTARSTGLPRHERCLFGKARSHIRKLFAAVIQATQSGWRAAQYYSDQPVDDLPLQLLGVTDIESTCATGQRFRP
ncbi:hypothetical protein [Nocardia sp. NPDC052112]|uniref:hypothetical protein n=1 Tax=Nocardia sp. NPDC052112 TaxID=3155646 RepID=UPI00343728B5